MDDQPKARPQSESDFFYDGSAMRAPVPGTVARGELREDRAFFEGKDASGKPTSRTSPVEATPELLARGARPLRHLLPALPRRARRRQGDPLPARRACRPRRSTTAKVLNAARRPDLRHDHERPGPDAVLPLADPAGRPLGDHRPRARAASASGQAAAERPSDEPPERSKIAVRVSLVVVAIAFAATVGIVRWVLSHEYRAPERSRPGRSSTPREQALAGRGRGQGQGRPREAVRRGRRTARFPVVGSRVAVWVRGAAAPAVRGVRAGGADLRADHRVHRLAERRQALRPSWRYEFTKLLVGVVLAHRDLRRRS